MVLPYNILQSGAMYAQAGSPKFIYLRAERQAYAQVHDRLEPAENFRHNLLLHHQKEMASVAHSVADS